MVRVEGERTSTVRRGGACEEVGAGVGSAADQEVGAEGDVAGGAEVEGAHGDQEVGWAGLFELDHQGDDGCVVGGRLGTCHKQPPVHDLVAPAVPRDGIATTAFSRETAPVLGLDNLFAGHPTSLADFPESPRELSTTKVGIGRGVVERPTKVGSAVRISKASQTSNPSSNDSGAETTASRNSARRLSARVGTTSAPPVRADSAALEFSIAASHSESLAAESQKGSNPAAASEMQRIWGAREQELKIFLKSFKGQLKPKSLDIFLACTAAEVYRLLVLERHWPVEDYETWLGDTLVSQLLQ